MSLDRIIHLERGIGHEDERRALSTVFNGDLDGFAASAAKVVYVSEDGESKGQFNHHHLWYVVEGKGSVSVDDPAWGRQAYCLREHSLLLLPRLVRQKASFAKGSCVIECGNPHQQEGSPSAPLFHSPYWINEPGRSTYFIFGSDVHFLASQVKLAHVRVDATLGGHFHDYDELFFLAKGDAAFDLEHVDSLDRSHFSMSPGDRIVIPRRTAHQVRLKEGSLLIGATERKYESPAVNDHPYAF